MEKVEALLRRRSAGWWEALSMEIPELKALTGTVQPAEYHAEGDVARHTRLAVEACPHGCDPDLLWVALLHDIGKPETTVQDDDGRVTAYGHARLGAEKAARILDRLGVPEQRCARIVWTIRHHVFHHSWQLQHGAELTKRQRAFLRDRNFPLLLEFLKVDACASHGHPGKLDAYDQFKALARMESS